MAKLTNCNPEFIENRFITEPIDFYGIPDNSFVELFDHNGYDLTKLEQLYCIQNGYLLEEHRNKNHISLRKEWYKQEETNCGAVLNHSYIFERKGYKGKALEQLREWTKNNPLLYKLINITPKYGIDFSMDYVDKTGECFEIFHYEYDGFNLEEIKKARKRLEYIIENTDWNNVAKDLIRRKKEWINLPFFEQSEWKCKYFDVPNEKFKIVTWQN